MLHERLFAGKKVGWAVIALAFALVAGTLCACGGQPAASDDTANAPVDEGIAPDSYDSLTPTNEGTPIDTSGWTKLGDMFAENTQVVATGDDDKYFIVVVNTDGRAVRAVAESNPDISPKLGELDFSAPDYAKQFAQAFGDLPLVSAEDISGGVLSEADMNALVGKTGQQLLDDGWIFSGYDMYGGEQTGATFDDGYFSYQFTFDVSIPDGEDDGGAGVANGTVQSVSYSGISNEAIDASLVK